MRLEGWLTSSIETILSRHLQSVESTKVLAWQGGNTPPGPPSPTLFKWFKNKGILSRKGQFIEAGKGPTSQAWG